MTSYEQSPNYGDLPGGKGLLIEFIVIISALGAFLILEA